MNKAEKCTDDFHDQFCDCNEQKPPEEVNSFSNDWLTRPSNKEKLGLLVNLSKPRGKWVTAIRYSFTCVGISTMREGLILVAGKPPERNEAKFWQWARNLLQNEPMNAQYEIEEILEFETRSRLI